MIKIIRLKSFFKGLSLLLLGFFSLVFIVIIVISSGISSNYYSTNNTFSLNSSYPISTKPKTVYSDALPASANSSNNKLTADIMLMGFIPIKSINVQSVEEKQLIPCGNPFGIRIYTDGVMIVGMSEINCNGVCNTPGKSSGLEIGDVITAIDGENINSNEEVQNAIKNCNGQALNLDVKRDDKSFQTALYPVKDNSENSYKAGLWVRDSCAGIGTLTYYDPSNNTFAGLGHGICDVDTGELLPLLNGDIVKATISSASKGTKGSPGELNGYFADNNSIGIIKQNCTAGLYGTMEDCISKEDPLPVATKQDIKTGYAQIFTTTEGQTPQYYDIEIESINHNSQLPSKNMVIKITSDELLDKTGGIVQGMSGSPIIQDGKLVGAVTHVFVNTPTKGYAIFAENMLISSNSLS